MQSPASNITPGSKAHHVRSMFAEIAPSYDFLNHALSLNVDKHWRRFVVKKVQDLLEPNARVLDLCCGTADLSLELGAHAPTFGIDFCHEMLERGASKTQEAGIDIALIEGDALNVPFADSTFNVITIAFGLRNLESTEDGLKEIYRLLKGGGRAAVLEFSQPQYPIFRYLFSFYFTRLLPKIGNAVSGSNFAYQYLSDSVQRFPTQKELASMLRSVGFSQVEYYNLFGGVACLHLGER
jgi:demethylmenaquinone methyltransferase / 2-methoxy-6-polyprenyl-1,4-benzoquinol methylase